MSTSKYFFYRIEVSIHVTINLILWYVWQYIYM